MDELSDTQLLYILNKQEEESYPTRAIQAYIRMGIEELEHYLFMQSGQGS